MATITDTNPDTGRPFTAFEATAQTQAQNQGKSGYDVLGNPVATPSPYVPTSGSINRTVDPGADAASAYLDTFTPPQTADQIAEAKRTQSQGLIDSINKTYDDQVSAAQKTGQEKVNMDNAVSVLSGLTGSTEASRTRGNVLDANDKAVQAINNQRAQQLASIYTKISSDAEAEAEQQKQDATKSAEDIVARRTQAQTDAVNNLKLMASGGLVDFDSFKNSPANAKVYQYALDSVGGSEDNLRAIFAMNRPKDQLVGTPQRVGDHYVQAYQNPLTGKVSYDTITVPGGLPTTYNSFQKIGDSKTGEFLYAIPDNWDGDQSKLKLVASTKGVGDGTGGSAQGYNGDFAATIDLAANQGGTNAQRAQIKTTLQSFIANGDYGSAYAAITNATSMGLKGTAATTPATEQQPWRA